MRSLLSALTVIAAIFAVNGSAAAQSFSPEEKSKIEAIVRDYLVQNPEILEEAFTALQAKRQAAEEASRKQALSQYQDELLYSDHQVVLGNPKGDVTLVEFFDYNCGYCRRALADTMRLLGEDEDLRVVLKEFPVLGQGSMEAAQVGIAVNEVAPDRYAEFHETLLGMDRPADAQTALAVAEDMNLPKGELEAVMEQPLVQETVEEVYTLANALGLTGTPSYVVGDEILFGAVGYDRLKQGINEARCGEAVC